MKPLNMSKKMVNGRSEKTVETVSRIFATPDTGLKPGVNERSSLRGFLRQSTSAR